MTAARNYNLSLLQINIDIEGSFFIGHKNFSCRFITQPLHRFLHK